MLSYFKSPHLFALWWFIKAPKNIALVIKRILLIINNQLSFTLNLRLIFTPLFGDYTIVGRCIGFTVRVFEIFFGVIIMSIVAVLYVVLPAAWVLLPIYLIYREGLQAATLFVGLYLIWALIKANTPEKRIVECKEDYLRCFKPSAVQIINSMSVDYQSAVNKLLKTKKVNTLLRRLELDETEFPYQLRLIKINDKDKLIKEAFDFAKLSEAIYVNEVALFIGIIKCVPNVEIFLSNFDAKLNVIEEGTRWIISENDRKYKMYLWQEDFNGMILGGYGKGMTGRVTPFLDSISEDFTRKALHSGYERYAVREGVIGKLSELLGASSENILIVGDAGAGKTSIVKGMAYQIMRGTAAKSLRNKRIVSLELSGILSGTKSVGEIAEKIKYAIGEAKASGNIILFIDEIHNLVSGSEGNSPEVSTILNLLEPELSKGDIQFIGATQYQSYRKYIEPNSSFSRLFHLFEIGESDFNETFKILEYVVRDVESRKNVFVTYVALEKAIELSKKLIHERVLPDKAIQIIDRATTYAENRTRLINGRIIAEVISEITHVPSAIVDGNEAKKLLNIDTDMKEMVIGQDHAIKQVAAALKRARAGVRNEGKPIASFLFVGTTGVGKTQTAKALAKTYFGNPKAMIRLDMSEYQQLDSMSRLLGTPDGKSKGILTEAVRSKPFALILLDEIEKAHSNILLTFLQVLDDGRLTDSSGTTIDFTNTIIIATSNVGTRSIQEIFAKNGTIEQMQEAATKDVRTTFAPEFLNRFSGIIVFNPLSVDDVRKITKILLGNVSKSAQEKNIKISFSDDLLEEVIKRGYSKEWGARPLARVIEDTVETYIAEKILSQEFKPGTTVTLGTEIFS